MLPDALSFILYLTIWICGGIRMIAITGISVDYARVTDGRSGHLAANDHPVISWAARSTKAGDKQTSYRLKVGSWNSGWVKTEENSARLPKGTLKPGVITEITLRPLHQEQTPLVHMLTQAQRITMKAIHIRTISIHTLIPCRIITTWTTSITSKWPYLFRHCRSISRAIITK